MTRRRGVLLVIGLVSAIAGGAVYVLGTNLARTVARPVVVCSIPDETVCRHTADSIRLQPDIALIPPPSGRVVRIDVRSGGPAGWTARMELDSGTPLIGGCFYVSEDLVECEVTPETPASSPD